MGLAASQARFLAITSRKMNCEFQSMQLAQQKLSVTRDLQKASQDYQYALDASKLVWEVENGDTYNLSYDLLMTPSVLNEYDPYLITDQKGKIVLSDAMFNAALTAGVIDANGDPLGGDSSYSCGKTDSKTDGSRNAFLYQLGVNNAAAPAVISSIVALKEKGYTKSGVGGEIFDKSTATAMNTNTFLHYLKTELKENSEDLKFTVDMTALAEVFGCVTNDANGEPVVDMQTLQSKHYCTSLAPNKDDHKDTFQIRNSSGSVVSWDDVQKLTVGDLISGKYSLTYISDTSGGGSDKLKKIFQALLKPLYDVNDNETRYTNREDLLITDSESMLAANTAWAFTELLFLGATSSNTNSVSNGVSTGVSNAANANNLQAIKYSYSGNTICCNTINLSNVLKSYLTYYAAAMDGFDSGLYVDKTDAKKSSFVTDDLSYNFIINRKDESTMTELDMLQADFYNMLYNNLCLYGACTDQTMRENVMDSEYLNYALKNGQLFISSLNNDGYFYQAHYTTNGHVGEVADEDAIARAELEYNNTKSKLNYKEEKLELEMKNLDMEISALSTEYDTVKNLISKGIEKVFTMFSS